jgi:predicted nucleotide-binding protein (sugar kinase/HSP70/actin superfamily)
MDDGLNLSLRDKLGALGLGLATPEDYAPAETESGAQRFLSKPLFWTLGRRLAGAAALMSGDPGIQGIVAVASFGCGPDSMVLELVERLTRRIRPDLPFMLLTLDEHTGEAGLRTRLEAFADLVVRRRAG